MFKVCEIKEEKTDFTNMKQGLLHCRHQHEKVFSEVKREFYLF